MELINSEQFNEKVFDLNESETVFKGDKPCIIDFAAEWCGPCKVLGRTLSEVSEEVDSINIYKVDIDESFDLATKYNVRNVPTMLFINTDGTVEKMVGSLPKPQILEKIESLS